MGSSLVLSRCARATGIFVLLGLSACNARTGFDLSDGWGEPVRPVIALEEVAPGPEVDPLDRINEDWRACLEEGRKLNALAGSQAEIGRYLASARVLEKCDLALTADQVAAFEPMDQAIRMRHLGLAVMDFIRAGDIESARRLYKRLDQHHRHHDLYFDDGSSLVETLGELLEGDEPSRLANISEPVRLELRRVHYWIGH